MANKLRDEDLNLNIIVNGDKGKKELGDLEQSTRKLLTANKDLTAEKKKLERAGEKESDRYRDISAEIKKNNAALKSNEARMTTLRKEIGLAGLTMQQLRSEQARLSRLMNTSTYGTENWKKYNAELKKVEAQMAKVKGGSQTMSQSIGKMADGFNRYFGMITAWTASLVGVVMGFKKASAAYAEFDDHVADVMKTTGMTKNEVLELDKELQKIDTRTAQDELLGLSRIAGKLGIKGVDDVEGFVKAADKINVALTEDLGGDVEESIRQIGKLTDIFKLKEEFGIEKAMLKIGSTINSLGAASTASEEYIVEFSKRVAGIAPAADISLPKIMGLAATLDQLGQTSEVSSTVFAQVIPDMFKDTATYAGVANMSLSDFTKLLNEDANEAFIKVLEGINGNTGGLQEMVNKLDALGLEGKRSIGVLGVLANNTELLKDQQKFANDEFVKGTSLTNEFNIKNETMQAKLEKSRKKLELITRELGESLSPAMLFSTNGVTYFIKALTAGIKIFKEYGPTIIGAAAAITAYTIALKLSNVETRLQIATSKLGLAAERTYVTVKALLTGKIKLATIAQKAWNTAVASNPIGAIAVVLIAVGAAIWQYNKNVNAVSKSEQNLIDVRKSAKESIIDQKLKVEDLLRVAKDETASLGDRKKALEELNKISPEYFGNLSLETINTEEATVATEEYIKMLEQKALVQAIDDKIQEIRKENAQADIEGTKEKVKWYQRFGNALIANSDIELYNELNKESATNNLTKAQKAYNDELKALYDLRAKTIGQSKNSNIKELNTDGTGDESNLKTTNSSSDKGEDTRLKALEIRYKKEQYARLLALEKGKLTDEQYKLISIEDEIFYLAEKEQLYKGDAEKQLDIQTQMAQKRIELTKMLNEDLEALFNQELDADFALTDAEKTIIEEKIKNAKLLSDEIIKETKRRMTEAEKEQKSEEDRLIYRRKMILDISAQIGQALGETIGDSEKSFKDFGKSIILIALDTLQAMVPVLVAQITGISLASPESVATAGIAGVAKAALMTIALEAVVAGAKAKVNSSMGSKKEGGYASSSISDDTAAGIYHANEFIASAPAVRNKSVKKVLDIVDYHQKMGTIGRINLPALIANANMVPGMKSGGFASTTSTTSTTSTVSGTNSDNTELAKTLASLNSILARGIGVNKYGTNGLDEAITDISNFKSKVGQ